jgi:arsenate reductase
MASDAAAQPTPPELWRRSLAECCGTAFLVAVVVGSGIAAQRLSPNDVGLQLLENATATAGGLVALILAFGPVSGAHLNPIVSIADALFGGLPARELPAYVAAQTSGAIAGAVVANLMFELDAVEWSTHARTSSGALLGEVVATIGLLVVIFGVVRSGRATAAPFAVGAYIGAAYFFTSSTSFANPAVTVGRAFTDTFAGIEPSSVAPFIGAQVAGGALAVLLIRSLYPDVGAHAEDVVVPHPRATDHDGVPAVLFLCVHNAGRSQMALGWFNHLADGRAVAWSGGSEPASEINPIAVQAMAEVGIDISAERPKRWSEEIVGAADVVVTMGCGDTCPFVPGKRYEDWQLDDPAGQGIESVRVIRDEIERRVRALLDQLGQS